MPNRISLVARQSKFSNRGGVGQSVKNTPPPSRGKPSSPPTGGGGADQEGSGVVVSGSNTSINSGEF